MSVTMNHDDYNIIIKYVFDICGIVLGDDKQYLIEQRLSPILDEFGCENFSQLAQKLNSGATTFLTREKMLNAMTTNETSFFRDDHPYVTFREKIMPDMMETVVQRKERSWQRRGPKVRMWSVAASTGQEPYSMAMLIAEVVSNKGMGLTTMEDFGILGTDISSKVLAKAMEGKYGPLEVARGLTPEMRKKYFLQDGEFYVINNELRHIVEFKAFNIQDQFTQIGSFDVIFCRNILIYFTDDAKRKILAQLYQTLAPNGYLLLGSAENMYNLNDEFTTERYGSTTIYRKPATNPAANTSTSTFGSPLLDLPTSNIFRI
ncbi:MAG: protein-glutamate O-methyltransferase CheR [Fibromonadaceae bacterium]|jgi:chemotaxis protein methyltransferase CheR|nr:protein-glutamate O-methyltransferase CheR [Fibromonadaceae bacterium]